MDFVCADLRTLVCGGRAPRPKKRGGWIHTSVGVPLPFFFFVIASEARQSSRAVRLSQPSRCSATLAGLLRRFASRNGVHNSGAQRVARTVLLIRPRTQCGGGGPCAAWWRGRAVKRICFTADTPSTALLRSAVPLPRFAGQDEEHRDSVMLHRIALYVSKRAIFVGRARSLPQRRRISKSRFTLKDLHRTCTSACTGGFRRLWVLRKSSKETRSEHAT